MPIWRLTASGRWSSSTGNAAAVQCAFHHARPAASSGRRDDRHAWLRCDRRRQRQFRRRALEERRGPTEAHRSSRAGWRLRRQRRHARSRRRASRIGSGPGRRARGRRNSRRRQRHRRQHQPRPERPGHFARVAGRAPARYRARRRAQWAGCGHGLRPTRRHRHRHHPRGDAEPAARLHARSGLVVHDTDARDGHVRRACGRRSLRRRRTPFPHHLPRRERRRRRAAGGRTAHDQRVQQSDDGGGRRVRSHRVHRGGRCHAGFIARRHGNLVEYRAPAQRESRARGRAPHAHSGRRRCLEWPAARPSR